MKCRSRLVGTMWTFARSEEVAWTASLEWKRHNIHSACGYTPGQIQRMLGQWSFWKWKKTRKSLRNWADEPRQWHIPRHRRCRPESIHLSSEWRRKLCKLEKTQIMSLQGKSCGTKRMEEEEEEEELGRSGKKNKYVRGRWIVSPMPRSGSASCMPWVYYIVQHVMD